MAMEERNGAMLVTILSSLMLGSSYVAIKIGVDDVDPFVLSALSMFVGTLVILAYMVYRRTLTRAMLRRWEFWAAPIVNTGVVAGVFYGETLTTAASAGLIIGTNVLFVTIFSFFLNGEKVRPLRAFGLFLGFFGLITITTKWDLGKVGTEHLVGDLFVLMAAICIALVVMLSQRALKHLTYDQLTLSLHMLLPLPLLSIGFLVGDVSNFSGDAWPVVLYIGILCTTVPTMMWTGVLNKIGVVTSATILMLESTFSVVLSVLILKEPLDVYIIVGALLTFIAIFFVAKGSQFKY